uniref:tRNA dimethylallyltransferase n=1 Tax=Glossina brevipalpis TaxID=37001 RepID=A0A1A9W250_9MUSC
MRNGQHESKSPIIVGGTNYYIESLLWNILINNPTEPVPHMKTNGDSTEQNSPITSNDTNSTSSEHFENCLFITESEMLTMSSELLYNHLRKIDPVTAQRIHSNNKRKIMRYLVYSHPSIMIVKFTMESGLFGHEIENKK